MSETIETPQNGDVPETTVTTGAPGTTGRARPADTPETGAQAAAGHGAALDAYVRFWNAGTPGERDHLAAAAFADGIRYHALIGTLSGPAELAAFRDAFVGEMGPAVFRPRAEPQVLPDRARLMWELEAGGRQPFATGTDVLVFDRDGRIESVSAFLDQAPEGFTPQAHH